MKYAVFLVAATMGSCLPQFPSGQKLPFKPAPEKSGIWCPIKSYDEDGCGTKRYCQAIDMIGQVLVHPEPKENGKRPFHFGFSAGPDCADRHGGLMTVTSCGTKTYCKAIDEWGSEDGRLQEDIRWSSTRECLDAHVPEPRNLPWKRPGKINFCGSRADYSENTCGTEEYCRLLEKQPGLIFTPPYIGNKAQCLAAHVPNPDAIWFPVE
ncbi:hypothetical protein VB005_07902 [Metarhizium brunneum]